MGDQYYLQLDCAYCGKKNPKPQVEGVEDPFPNGVFYGESSGATTFKCEYCGKTNKIEMSFKAVKTK